MNKTIWVIEDSIIDQDIIKDYLSASYILYFFDSNNSFISSIKTTHKKPSLIIADLNLAGSSFFEYLVENKFTDIGDIPLIIVSGVDEKDILHQCFNIGVQDYLTKPFNKQELLVKVERILNSDILLKKTCTMGAKLELNINNNTFKVSRKNEKNTISLTPKELVILNMFCSTTNGSVKRSEFVQSIWGHNNEINPKSLDVHLSNLRRKLKKINIDTYSISLNTFSIESIKKRKAV